MRTHIVRHVQIQRVSVKTAAKRRLYQISSLLTHSLIHDYYKQNHAACQGLLDTKALRFSTNRMNYTKKCLTEFSVRHFIQYHFQRNINFYCANSFAI